MTDINLDEKALEAAIEAGDREFCKAMELGDSFRAAIKAYKANEVGAIATGIADDGWMDIESAPYSTGHHPIGSFRIAKEIRFAERTLKQIEDTND